MPFPDMWLQGLNSPIRRWHLANFMFWQIFWRCTLHLSKLAKLLFQNVHIISWRKVDIITFKKKSVSCGVITQDARGKHDCAFNLADERAEIKDHSEGFPKYSSHYSRHHTKKMYLPSNLNMKKCMICKSGIPYLHVYKPHFFDKNLSSKIGIRIIHRI
jgi:hypothetical protein